VIPSLIQASEARTAVALKDDDDDDEAHELEEWHHKFTTLFVGSCHSNQVH
jgi:hypothetical protein